jgi:hypothetical protein
MKIRFSLTSIFRFASVLCVALCIAVWLGHGELTELSLTTFQVRRVSYIEIPWTGRCIWRRESPGSDTSLSQVLQELDALEISDEMCWSVKYQYTYDCFIANPSYGPVYNSRFLRNG